MDTPIQPPPFEFGMPEPFDALRTAVPPRLMALAAKGPAVLGLEAPTIVAAGLAHLAAAMGRSVLLDDGAYNLVPGFSLAVLDDTAHSLEWLSNIGKGWVDQAVSLRAQTPDAARIAIRQYMQEAAVRSPRPRSGDPQIDQCLQNIPENLVSMLRTQYVAHKTDPVTLASSLVHSSDHAVTAVNGAMDPFQEWASQTPGKQRQLTEMLTMSWKGKPMEISTRGGSAPASLTCLWQTRTAAVREALCGNLATLARNPAPILMFSQKGVPARFPRVEAIEFGAWFECLGYAFGNRLQASKPTVIILDPELKRQAAVWFTQFNAALAKTPQPMQPWLSWLPDLVLRIYLVLLISSSIHTILGTIPTDPERQRQLALKERQKIMSDAIALTRWLAQEHFCAVQDLLGTDSLTFTDSTDMQTLEDGILQRLRDYGPMTPRELQRKFHALSAQTRDGVVQRLKSNGLVTDNPDGVLRLT